jgi:hypothetical protein
MLRDEPYAEFRVESRLCVRHTGDGDEGRALADLLANERRQHGDLAAVYRRTWTPGPWVAVDPPGAPS